MSAQDIDIGFVGGCYKGRSIAVDGQECINFYPEIVDNPLGNSKTKIALFPTPGLTVYTTLGDAVADFSFTNGTWTWPDDGDIAITASPTTLTVTDESTGAISWLYRVYGGEVTWELIDTSTLQNPAFAITPDAYTYIYIELIINGGVTNKLSDQIRVNLA